MAYLASCSTRLLLHEAGGAGGAGGTGWALRLQHGGYNEVIRDAAWSDDGKYLLQVNPKGLVEILSTTDTEVRSLQHVPLRETWAASFHREGHRNVAIGSKTGQVSIWDTKHKNMSKTFPTPAQTSTVNMLSFNAKNTNLAATMQNGDTIIYGMTSNSPVLTVKIAKSKSVSAMKFHHESRSILGLSTDEGHVLLRDITTNKDKVFFKSVHASPVSDFTYSMINRDVLLSCGYDKVMHVFDVRMENIVSTIRTSYPLTSVAINAENYVALGSRKGVLLVYDLRDFTSPLVLIHDHKDEVRKVAFQPSKKKIISNELSLKEETGQILSPKHSHSPMDARMPDLFLMCDSPSPKAIENKNSGTHLERVDSFLLMMGLDKSSVDDDDTPDQKKSVDACFADRKQDTLDLKFRPWDSEKSVAKSSTPLAGKSTENLATLSSFSGNGTRPLENSFKKLDLQQESKPLTITQQVLNTPFSNSNETNIQELGDELKDLIKLSMADLAEDNRNCFLHLMMALTKQKLFLEKELTTMVDQMQGMQRTQNVLLEENKRLFMEVELLKANKYNNL